MSAIAIASRAETMDSLLAEAMSLGRVKLEQDWSGKTFDAEIVFTRKSGTRIHAKASHSNPAFAMADAIDRKSVV